MIFGSEQPKACASPIVSTSLPRLPPLIAHIFICHLFKNYKNRYIYYRFLMDTKMKKPRLDALDLRIIKELQADGRMTNVELAKRVGISAPPCLRRVRALEEAGVIQSYHAEVDASQIGYMVTVFAMVGLHSQAEADLQAFETLIGSWPEVRECHMLNGDIDFILKIIAPDLASFQTFLTRKLTPAPNVANVKTSLTIRQSKKLAGVPVD